MSHATLVLAGLLAALIALPTRGAQDPPVPGDEGAREEVEQDGEGEDPGPDDGGQEPPAPAPEGPAPEESSEPEPDPGAAEAESEGDAAVRLDPSRPATLEELTAVLQELAAAHPDHVELRSLGRSRDGRDVPLLVLGTRGDGSPDERPGLVLLDAQGGRGGGGAETGLELARVLLEELAAGSVDAERLLRRRTVYVVPAADPDARGGSPGAAQVQFDRNFPVGWQPGSIRPGSGAFPLSEPETLAVAEFLARRGNVSLVLVSARAPRGSAGSAGATGSVGIPPADQAVFDALARRSEDPHRPQVLPWSALGGASGRAVDYAYQELGMVSALLAPVAEPRDGPERSVWVQAAVEVVRGLVRDLPRLVLGDTRVERIRPGLYRVDLRCSNAGVLPTLSALGADRHTAGSVELSATGGEVIACAHRQGGRDVYDVEAVGTSTFRLGQIDGGAGTELCLVVEAEDGSVLELVGRSERAGSARLRVTLE